MEQILAQIPVGIDLIAARRDTSLDQFILGRDFARSFDVTIELNDRLLRITDSEWN